MQSASQMESKHVLHQTACARSRICGPSCTSIYSDAHVCNVTPALCGTSFADYPPSAPLQYTVQCTNAKTFLIMSPQHAKSTLRSHAARGNTGQGLCPFQSSAVCDIYWSLSVLCTAQATNCFEAVLSTSLVTLLSLTASNTQCLCRV